MNIIDVYLTVNSEVYIICTVFSSFISFSKHRNIVDAKRAFNHSFCLRTLAEPDLEDNSGCNQSNEAITMIQSRVLSLFEIVPSNKEDMLEKGRWKHDKVKRSKLVLTFDLTLLASLLSTSPSNSLHRIE